jgi:hypothetical protein
MYDYYCLLFAVLEFLGFKDLTPKTVNSIYNIVKGVKDKLSGDINETNIDNIVSILNSVYPFLNLPECSKDPELFNCYKNIVYLILFTCGYYGNLPIDKFYPEREKKIMAISSV